MKKFNAKLTICLVSLFIGLVFFVFGANNDVCLCLGCIFLAVASVFFAQYNKDKMNKILMLTEEEMSKEEKITHDDYFYVEVEKQKLIKQNRRVQFTSYAFAVLSIIFAFIVILR